MRLISYNYSQLTETVLTASSSNSNFPVSNIRHEHRSKEWRSNGNFRIGADKKTLNFSLGGDHFTVELTEGSYLTAALRVEIQNKMNAASGSNFVISYSSKNGLWTISNSESFTIKSSSSLLSVIGFNAVDRTGTSLTGARSAIHTEEFVTFDLKTTEEIDSIVLLWGIGQYKLSNTAEIRIQGNATANFEAPAVDQILTYNEDFEVASHYFDQPQSFRYWRVVIKDSANPTGYVNLGVVVLGLGEKMDPENGFTYNQVDNSNTTRTDFGQEYTDVYPVTAVLEMNFALMEYPQAESLIKMFKKVGTRTPVFAAIDPEELVFSKDCFAIYGKFNSSNKQQHNFYDIFDSGLSIRETN